MIYFMNLLSEVSLGYNWSKSQIFLFFPIFHDNNTKWTMEN